VWAHFVPSRRVANGEPELLQLLGDVLDIADGYPGHVGDGHGRRRARPADRPPGQPRPGTRHIPGIAVNPATDSYRGADKTDARDARVNADQARMRRELQLIRPGDDATIALRLLTDHGVGLVADRTRTTNRLRALLDSMF
jgi:hypothetical protein